MSTKKLKLGLLTDSYQIPAWAYHSLARIENSNYAEVSLIILNHKDNLDKPQFDKDRKNGNQIIYNLFNRVDEKLFRIEPNALQLRSLQEIVLDTPVIQVKPIQSGDFDYFESADSDRINEYRLDILVKIGFRTLKGEILSAARNGVWTYQLGDINRNNGNLPGFWEVVEKRPETSACLLRLGNDLGDSQVLYQSWFATYPFSPARNRNSCLWAASSFLPRQIERLHCLGEEQFNLEIKKISPELNHDDPRPYQVPTNTLSIKLILKHLTSLVKELYQRTFYLDFWHLLISLHEDETLEFDKFKKILPPKDRFWADPHVCQKDGTYYVFIEEYLHKNRKGHISVIEIDQHGNYKKPVRALEKEYHLSYPFVFEQDNHYYMVPESAQRRAIELYECVEFPSKWQFKMNLMENVRAVDTTLFYHLDKWWLFTAITENQGAFPQAELFLYYANDLFTNKWHPHPRNPIVSDMKKARSAGRIFIRNGKIFRPSQYCSTHYGYGFNLNEIQILTETEYLERELVSVKPHWNKDIQATHTFACESQLTVIDALKKRRKVF